MIATGRAAASTATSSSARAPWRPDLPSALQPVAGRDGAAAFSARGIWTDRSGTTIFGSWQDPRNSIARRCCWRPSGVFRPWRREAPRPTLLRAMGISRQSLYDTFGDKRRLYLEALQRTMGAASEIPRSLNTGASPLQRLEAALVACAFLGRGRGPAGLHGRRRGLRFRPPPSDPAGQAFGHHAADRIRTPGRRAPRRRARSAPMSTGGLAAVPHRHLARHRDRRPRRGSPAVPHDIGRMAIRRPTIGATAKAGRFCPLDCRPGYIQNQHHHKDRNHRKPS